MLGGRRSQQSTYETTEGLNPSSTLMAVLDGSHGIDTCIRTHPVRIVSVAGEWTSVIGVLEGTFTKPMPGPNGTTIAPTSKAFRLQMVTVGYWQGATMDKEYLFYDNQAFMKQIGVG